MKTMTPIISPFIAALKTQQSMAELKKSSTKLSGLDLQNGLCYI
jgi:hypothetical protein